MHSVVSVPHHEYEKRLLTDLFWDLPKEWEITR